MKVLFICYANVCRSFIAQEILRREMPEAEVFSRGVYADPSFSVPSKVTNFLASQSITPKPHTPTPLTPADLETADYIFCMEQAHLEKLADQYAQHWDKLWLLTEFVNEKSVDVPDPIALTGADFVQSAQELAVLVRACARKLKGENK